MTRDEVKEVFKILTNVYPQFEVTKEKLDIWHRFLRKDNPAVVMRNTEKFIIESKYPPALADLKESHHPAYQSNIVEKVRRWEEEASVKK